MLNTIKKTKEYIDYIEEHYRNVQKSWIMVKARCEDMFFMNDKDILSVLNEEIKNHDISKFGMEEFVQYRKFFFPVNDEEKKGADDNFNSAWNHHKRNNPHHWEVWTKIHNRNYQEICLIHNIVDWMAMGMKFKDTAKSYYENNKDHIKLPDWAIKIMYEIFDKVYTGKNILSNDSLSRRGKKKKTIRPNLPNIGLEIEYRRKLDALIKSMNTSVHKVILDKYKSPSSNLVNEINIIMPEWIRNFDEESGIMSEWFVKRSDSSTRSNIGNSLAKATGMTVKFKTTEAVEGVIDGIIAENVDLIKSIPREYHTQVNKYVMESVRAGRDIGGLSKTLFERYDITRNRAEFIARDQNNKATEMIGNARNRSLGIVEGSWLHRSGSKTPRKSHIRANGKIFRLDTGLVIDGQLLLPGQDYNCNCSYRPIIPGFS